VFIAATTDSKFRAFNSRTGEELWVAKLDASGTTVPMTYLGSDGQQYVVVAAGGTNRFRMIANTADKNSDSLIAFAVSDKQEAGSGPQPNSSPAPQRSPNASGSTAGASPTGAMADLPEGQGKATVIAVCTKCHGPNNFTTLRMSRSAWETEVADMKDKGAVGTDDDFKRIVEYLAQNFPPR
jgi:quinoprotein glucose dehydrogenase